MHEPIPVGFPIAALDIDNLRRPDRSTHLELSVWQEREPLRLAIDASAPRPSAEGDGFEVFYRDTVFTPPHPNTESNLLNRDLVSIPHRLLVTKDSAP